MNGRANQKTNNKIDPRDQRIDVGAKFSLSRMLKKPDTHAGASRLISAINNGQLAGIYGDDLGAAVQVARKHNTQRWLLVPKGEDAALVLDPAKPLTTPPNIIFRGDTPDIRSHHTRIDAALIKAGHTFHLWQTGQLSPCNHGPSGDASRTVASVAGSHTIPSNLVPPILCQTGGGSSVNQCLQNFPTPAALPTPARDLTRTEARDIVVHLVKQGAFTLFDKVSPLKFDKNCDILSPKPTTKIGIKPPVIDGVRFLNIDPGGRSFLARLDVRTVVMLFRLANTLRTRWGASVISFSGLGGGREPNDNHDSGRGMDFFGVEGTIASSKNGVVSAGKYKLNVLKDWGEKPVSLSGKKLPDWPSTLNGKPFRNTTYRLDPKENPFVDKTDRQSVLAFNVFRDVYDFAAGECSDISTVRRGNTAAKGSPTTIGNTSNLIIHPDHPNPKLRPPHKNHIHMQIGPTGVEKNPPP